MGDFTERKSVPVTEPESVAKKQRSVVKTAGTEQNAMRGIVGPPVWNLGDHAVGDAYFSDVFLSNIEAHETWVSVRYVGDPSISILSAPQRYRPSYEGFDPNSAIKLAYSPTNKGHHRGVIEVVASWAGGKVTTTKVAIEAACHEVGQQDLADEERDERVARGDAERLQRDKAKADKAERSAEWRLDHNVFPGSPGNRERLADATADVTSSLMYLLQDQEAGVTTAQAEAQNWTELAPVVHESLLETLAFAAIDIATAGIAGALAKTLEVSLARGVERTVETVSMGRTVKDKIFQPGDSLIASISNVVQETPKQAISLAKKRLAEPNEHKQTLVGGLDPQGPSNSSDSLLSFFQTQRASLTTRNRDKADELSKRSKHIMEPLLTTQPHEAVATMAKLAADIRALGAGEMAANIQATQSALYWARYVADASMGPVAADSARANGLRADKEGGATASLVSANAAPGESGQITRHEGLIDIEFKTDVFDVSRVEVVGVRVNGVSNAILARIKQNFRSTKQPVRIYAYVGGARIEVVRDEAGNVAFSDETGVAGMPGNWFQRRSGQPNGGHDVALRAASRLVSEVYEQTAHELEGSMQVVGNSAR